MSTDLLTTGDGCTFRLTKFDIASILSRWRAVVIVAGLCWVKHQSPLYRVRSSRVALYVWSSCARTSSWAHVPTVHPSFQLRIHCISSYDARYLSCIEAHPFFKALKKDFLALQYASCSAVDPQRLILRTFLSKKNLGIVNRSHRSRFSLRMCSNVTGSACS